jgi:hypothetical protein
MSSCNKRVQEMSLGDSEAKRAKVIETAIDALKSCPDISSQPPKLVKAKYLDNYGSNLWVVMENQNILGLPKLILGKYTIWQWYKIEDEVKEYESLHDNEASNTKFTKLINGKYTKEAWDKIKMEKMHLDKLDELIHVIRDHRISNHQDRFDAYLNAYISNWHFDINRNRINRYYDRCGETALIASVKKWKIDFVKKILDVGADVNQGDFRMQTPLHHACKEGFCDVVEFLLLQGADPFKQDIVGWLPHDYTVGDKKAVSAQKIRDLILSHIRSKTYKWLMHNHKGLLKAKK